MKIRNDLIGAVHVGNAVLFAGDTVPEGAEIDSWLLDGEPTPVAKAPDSNAGKAKWQAFLKEQGVAFDAALTRNELRDLWGEYAAS